MLYGLNEVIETQKRKEEADVFCLNVFYNDKTGKVITDEDREFRTSYSRNFILFTLTCSLEAEELEKKCENAIKEIHTSGYCNGVRWTLDENGVLILTPDEAHPDCGLLPNTSTSTYALTLPEKTCRKVKKLIIKPGVRTNESAEFLFGCLRELEEIEGLENLDTSMTKYMDYMFYDCCSLKELDLSSFDTSSVETADCMIKSCTDLQKIDVSCFKREIVFPQYRKCVPTVHMLSFWRAMDVLDFDD